MSTATAYSAIKAYLDANWTSSTLVYENSDTPQPATPVPFVFVEISGNMYDQASVGADRENLFREDGSVWLHVMVPSGTGSLLARQHGEALVEMLRSSELLDGRLVFRTASVGLGEAGTEDGNYWRLPIRIDWQLDT